MINLLANSLKTVANRITAGQVADLLKFIQFGSVLMALPTTIRGAAPAADPSSLATLQTIKLPDDAKAASLLRVTVLAGGAPGELAIVGFGTTPATGQAAVTPSGDIAFLAADAPTNVDVLYVPEQHDVVEYTGPVVANVLTLPAAYAGSTILVEEVNADVGTATGRKIVLVPGAAAPVAGQARLNLAKTTISFAAADAVTKATVKLAVDRATSLPTQLAAVSPII